MKKLLAIIAVAGFVACNNSAEADKTADTPTVKIDSPAAVTPDSPAVVMPDSPAVKVDSPAVAK